MLPLTAALGLITAQRISFEMGDHYVPQYYLKGFSKDNGKNIWVYDKRENREFGTQVKSVGNITDFYSADVEQYLADIIEGPANTVIERVRNQEQISESEKEILSEYMAVMFKRVPRGRERLTEMAPSISTNLPATVYSTTNYLLPSQIFQS